MADMFPAEYVDWLKDGIEQLLNEVKRVNIANVDGFKPGSQAETEHSTYANPDSIYNAAAIAGPLIDVGADHLSVFRKILIEPVEVSVTWTCVRSMLESCALATWLLDPTIDAQARVSRVFAIRYEGMEQQVTFARTGGFPQSDVDAQKKRIEDVEQDAFALGFKRVEDRNGKRIGIGEQMPSATELIKITLGEDQMYRTLSAVAHGHNWAIRQLCYIASEADDGNVGATNTKAFKKEVSVDKIAWVAACGVRAFIRPLWNQCRYFGWNQLQFEELFENVADKLRMSNPTRFWRN